MVAAALDLIFAHSFRLQVKNCKKMSSFLELIWAYLCILIIKEDILILGEGSTQGLDDTTLRKEA